MSKEHGTAIIVGGGMSGILAALLLKQKFPQVHLIEREAQIGGSLRSIQNTSGDWFDFGTHVLKETGIVELDKLLFGVLREHEWHYFDYLQSGNYFNGALNEESPCLDVTRLPERIYEKGIVELLSVPPKNAASADLRTQLQEFYGKTFAEQVFRPIIQKLYGVPPETLAADAHLLFGLSRLIALLAETTKELKKSPLFDKKLAFHRRLDGAPAKERSFYPREGGIGKWVSALEAELRDRGVTVGTSQSIESIVVDENTARLTVKPGGTLQADFLVWTVPPFLLIKAAQLDFPSKPPVLRKVTLFHLVFDQPFLTPLHYLHCYDERVAAFRVTLYPNLQGKNLGQQKRFPCTVEILSAQEAPFESEKITDKIVDELQEMGIISATARLLHSSTQSVTAGFPVYTNEFVDQCEHQVAFVKESLPYVLLLGKAAGGTFFMDDVLRETYSALSSI